MACLNPVWICKMLLCVHNFSYSVMLFCIILCTLQENTELSLNWFWTKKMYWSAYKKTFSVFLHSPGSSDKAALNQQLNVCHENWKFEKNKHVAADKEQTADTKRSFSPNTIERTTTEPETHPSQRPQQDSHSNSIRIGTFVPFYAGGFGEIGRTDSECREDDDDELSRKHFENVRKRTQCRILTNDQLSICFFFSFFYIHIYIYLNIYNFFFSFCCLHYETPYIGREIQTNKNKSWLRVESDVQVEKLVRIHLGVYFFILFFCTSVLQDRLTPPHTHTHPTPLGAQRCSGSKPSPQLRGPRPPPLRSLGPPPSLFHFQLANRGDAIRWCDTHALSVWSLFTCRGIRASSGSWEKREPRGRVREGEHATVSHNTNSACAPSSPHLCTINLKLGMKSVCTSVVRRANGEASWGRLPLQRQSCGFFWVMALKYAMLTTHTHTVCRSTLQQSHTQPWITHTQHRLQIVSFDFVSSDCFLFFLRLGFGFALPGLFYTSLACHNIIFLSFTVIR